MAVESFEQEPPVQDKPATLSYRWYQKAAAVLYVFFCFEVGIFLLLFPWLDLWNRNYFSGITGWSELWNNPYFRGAISGRRTDRYRHLLCRVVPAAAVLTARMMAYAPLS